MSSTTAEAYQIHLKDTSRDHNSPNIFDNFSLVTIPKPQPGPGEVLVRIRAAALNYRDLLVLVNSPLYPVVTTPGLTPGADGAGEIEAVGAGSTWANGIGEGVILVTNRGWIDSDDCADYDISGTLGSGDLQGTLRQYAIVRDELLIKKPRNLSFEEAASLPGAAGVAMHALGVVKVGKGTTVLTQGTGGVSCFAIQFAAALGARVIVTSSSEEKLQIAKSLGATDLINYKTRPDWPAEVFSLTNDKGVDLVVEVGGSQTIKQSLNSTKIGGTVALIGFLTPPEDTDLVMELIFGGKTLKGIRGNSKVMLEDAVKIIEQHNLHPFTGTPYEWNNAHKAFQSLREGGFVGKIVIKV